MAQKKKTTRKTRRTGTNDRLKPLSLYPLKPEEALGLFMRVDPSKLKDSEKELKVDKRERARDVRTRKEQRQG
jgi:hypothetical protein